MPGLLEAGLAPAGADDLERPGAEPELQALLADQTSSHVRQATLKAVGAWANVPGVGRWARIRAAGKLLTLEFYLGGVAIEQGIGLSNQKTPPFNCTDCAPTLTSPNELAITFARLLEYAGADAPLAETDCATIVGVTAEGALYKNVLSLRQQPASRACRFDTFVWIPEDPNPDVYVAAQAAPNSNAATRLQQLGATRRLGLHRLRQC